MHAFDRLSYAEQGTLSEGSERLPYTEQGTLFGKSPCTTPFDGLPYAKQEGIDCLNVRLTVQTRISYKANATFA